MRIASALLLLCTAAAVGQALPVPDGQPDDCARTGRGCLGGVGDIGVMRSEIRLMRLLFDEMGLPVPAACACAADAAPCTRRCYFAMLGAVNLDRGLQLLSR